MKKPLLLAIAMSIAVGFGFAQDKNHWLKTATSPPQSQIKSARVNPTEYHVFGLDVAGMKAQLTKAPEREKSGGVTNLVVVFPTPDGAFERYQVMEASVLHPDLAAKFPGIKSYAGKGIDDPSATIRFSVSNQTGLHGMVLSGTKKLFFIDPYTNDHSYYMVYNREGLDKSSNFICSTIAEKHLNERTSSNLPGNTTLATNDKKMRKYRLALSCTAEYGNIFAGTSGTDAQKKANIMAQMNITMTRVIGVYERDLAITMQIVANNDLIMYYGSTTTDPWSSEWNTKTQQVIDAAIGNANYDIGHNFNTTGGGNAGCIGCVCTTGSKGSGYTGRSDPTGDAFDIDYVAHEMGHQFGGYHIQSSSNCRSGSGTTEVEPGSGSSIMGYAGICPSDVQSNSDAYFAYVNIRDISANVKTGASSGCAQIISLTNNPPTANAGLDYTIPKSTAFVLRGQGTDPDGDALTYTWEENDPENPNTTAAPTSTRAAGPMFRSRQGTSSPNRYFPQMSDVVANNLTPTWEVVPSIARALNFSLVVRDNKAGGGQTADDLMKVTVNGTAGPFVVGAPNTAVSWAAGSLQTVTWSVAGTNVSPVNCQNVNILLSTDGGFTYPVTVLANTPNDGTQSVTIPNNPGTTCRIKIEAADNIFFDISNVNFTITPPATCTATVPTGLAASSITSTGATLSWTAVPSVVSYDVQYRVVGTSTWSSVSAASNSTTLSGLTAASNYEAQVRSNCTSSSSAYSASATFTTAAGCVATTPTGLAASGITSSGASLNWTAVSGTTYNVQYRVVGTSTWTTVSASTNSTSLSGLTANTQYEAQVRSNCAGGSSSAYSASATFTTLTIQITYCASKGTTVTDEYIGRVQLGTINNATGANAGYGNFTSLSTSLTAGSAYTITVTPTWTGSTYSEGYAVWIDYNQNGVFTDAGELVWSKAASTTTPVSGTFTVPSTATAGSTRMRVSMKYNGIPTSCETFSYGEVEDYTVNIGAAGPDTQAPSTPTGLAASNITQTSATISWTASTDDRGVTGYEVRVNGTLNGTSTTTSYALSGLTASTTYAVSVIAKDAAGNASAAASINVTTTGSCTNVTLTLLTDDYPTETSWNIKRNSTGATVASGGTYASTQKRVTITSTSCLVAACYTFTINDSYGDGICCAYGNGSYTLKDGSGTVLGSGSTFTSSATINFCVGGGTSRDGGTEVSENESETHVYPNPVSGTLYLSVPASAKVQSVQIISTTGVMMSDVKKFEDGIDVSGLNSGLYILSVKTDKGMVTRKFIKQ